MLAPEDSTAQRKSEGLYTETGIVLFPNLMGLDERSFRLKPRRGRWQGPRNKAKTLW